MQLTPQTRINDLIADFPFLLDFLADYNPRFSLLRNRAMRATLGRVATLAKVSAIGDVPLEKLMRDVAERITRETGQQVELAAGASEAATAASDAEAQQELKEIIRELHRGVPFDQVKQRFDRLMTRMDPSRIAELEQQLIAEGMPAEEIQRLCDLHVTLFESDLAAGEPVSAPEGHPVHTYLLENERFTALATRLNALIAEVKAEPAAERLQALRPRLEPLLQELGRIELHYSRKENQLFPFLEKHGITGPSQVMWGIHDEIRGLLKGIRTALIEEDAPEFIARAAEFSRAVTDMIYKENAILFPMALEKLTGEEWVEIRAGEDAIGYAFVTPGTAWPPTAKAPVPPPALAGEGLVRLDTGSLTLEQLNRLLTHLPVELSFVDHQDTVRYYSDTPERLFPRSPGVIGRKVQNCHPPKSLHVVEELLRAFKSGEKSKAGFWIQMKGRFILIQYFAVRDKAGEYLGTVEVTQDITEIRKLEGEKRLLELE